MCLTIKKQLEMAEFTRYTLSDPIKRYIKYQEKYLERTCRKIWQAENREGFLYMYGSFCKNYDRLFITLAYFDENINLFVPMEIGK
jgi:hypothetical protein